MIMKAEKPSLLTSFFTTDRYAFEEHVRVPHDDYTLTFMHHRFRQQTTFCPGPAHEFLGLYFNLENNYHGINKFRFNLIYVPETPREILLPRGTCFTAMTIRISRDHLQQLVPLFPSLHLFLMKVKNKIPARLSDTDGIIAPELHDIFNYMYVYLLEKSPLPAEVFAHLKIRMPDLIFTVLRQLTSEYDPQITKPVHQWRTILAARQYLRDHYCSGVTLAELVYLMGTNKNLLEGGFKKMFGCPMHAYLVMIRIIRGMELLRETHLPVQIIASRVGYRSLSNFSVAFKKRTGYSPAAYRNSFSLTLKPAAKERKLLPAPAKERFLGANETYSDLLRRKSG